MSNRTDIQTRLDANNAERVALDKQIADLKEQQAALNRENEDLQRRLQLAVAAEDSAAG